MAYNKKKGPFQPLLNVLDLVIIFEKYSLCSYELVYS